ncbi:hypothetical protein Anas_01830 [Armadillidium nasatum]|uniref:Uncharacterized protein n=1 Tax=Armadillidium nasatum TaxID=96803 RepID=A0A5N5T3V4_9CRUS|nr:hypothetical protein Anas_01830 [Armadillidium nasatum]
MECRVPFDYGLGYGIVKYFVDNIDYHMAPYNIDEITLESRPVDSTFYIQVLHYHYYRGMVHEHEILNTLLNDSIPSLKNLSVINFCDARIEDQILRVIALNCRSLTFLNLHKTGVSVNGIKFLCGEDSVVKPCLKKLISDYTNVSPLSAMLCLLAFMNLKYFLSDSTIWAVLRFLESVEDLASKSGGIVKFKTSILKNNFATHRFRTPNEDMLWEFYIMFPKVHRLIFTSVRRSSIRFTNILILMMNLTELDLSADVDRTGRNYYTFYSLKESLDRCGDKLLSLKLEKFLDVNVFYLATQCKNLMRLFLINNTFDDKSYFHKIPNLFKELIELQIILVRNQVNHLYRELFLSEAALYSLLSSSQLIKVLIYCQARFSDIMMGDLFEDDHLQNLNEIFIYHCDHITNLTLWELVNNTRPIEKVETGFSTLISNDLVEMLKGYIKEKKLKVSISNVTNNPYFLRWSVVDLPISDRDTFDLDNSDLYINQIME